jgi:hypothetical protein
MHAQVEGILLASDILGRASPVRRYPSHVSGKSKTKTGLLVLFGAGVSADADLPMSQELLGDFRRYVDLGAG